MVVALTGRVSYFIYSANVGENLKSLKPDAPLNSDIDLYMLTKAISIS
jgi:hypothetical protein